MKRSCCGLSSRSDDAQRVTKTPLGRQFFCLEDGTRFEGAAIGATGTTTGEVAFNTGMYGYQEIFTDPSYKGQVLVMATAHIGNYGVHSGRERKRQHPDRGSGGAQFQ